MAEYDVPMSDTPESEDFDFPLRARKLVAKRLFPAVDVSEVYVVWFTYTLGNWKALVSSMVPDDLYYEVTYDRDNQRTYIDAYRKINQLVIKD